MSAREAVSIRPATRSQARRIHRLIAAGLDEGRLLPRTVDDVVAHVNRFVVALRGRRIVGCAELAALGPQVAEVRSLVVDPGARGLGVGVRIVVELIGRARRLGFDRLCAFTHAPGYFSHLGFSIVPHRWIPEKIAADCVGCARFGRCDQVAMAIDFDTAVDVVESDRVISVRAL